MAPTLTNRTLIQGTALTVGNRREARDLVGYPYPSSPHATTIMRANPSRDTGPELRLRSLLHANGLRYRVNLPVRADDRRPILVDVAFTKLKLAIFVDGCFWHACPLHGTVPRANPSYWPPKLRRTVERDRATSTRLERAGWAVLRFWEHEEPGRVGVQVAEMVAHLRGAALRSSSDQLPSPLRASHEPLAVVTSVSEARR
jgi:DNA mismatch endonuclease (patch repair protein)